MPDEAHSGFMDRGIFAHHIQESFLPQLELLEQLVNYGTNLIPRCYISSNKKIPELVCLLSFLKHAVTSVDAISILAKEGAVLSCFPHMRSLFEIQLYLSWIFDNDYKLRGTAYFVWNIRRRRFGYRCALEGTAEYAAHKKHMKDFPSLGDAPYTQEEIRDAAKREDARLQISEVAEVNQLFEKRMKPSGKDVDWYEPFGVNSIRGMAIQMKDEGMYKIFYTRYSQATHGLSLDQQVHFDAASGEVIYDHIRTFESIDEVFKMTFPLVIGLYRRVLNKYRPDELNAFGKKYINEWQAASQNVPTVKKDGGTLTIYPAKQQDNKLV